MKNAYVSPEVKVLSLEVEDVTNAGSLDELLNGVPAGMPGVDDNVMSVGNIFSKIFG